MTDASVSGPEYPGSDKFVQLGVTQIFHQNSPYNMKNSDIISENSVMYNSTGWVVGYDEKVDVWTSGIFLRYIYESVCRLIIHYYIDVYMIFMHIIYILLGWMQMLSSMCMLF